MQLGILFFFFFVAKGCINRAECRIFLVTSRFPMLPQPRPALPPFVRLAVRPALPRFLFMPRNSRKEKTDSIEPTTYERGVPIIFPRFVIVDRPPSPTARTSAFDQTVSNLVFHLFSFFFFLPSLPISFHFVSLHFVSFPFVLSLLSVSSLFSLPSPFTIAKTSHPTTGPSPPTGLSRFPAPFAK